MKTTKAKAIGYVRVSTDKQADDGVSLAAQRDKIKAYCELHDLTLVEVCADEGISGKRADNRPGLQRALVQTCKLKATLVVYSLSRVARSVRDCIDISERIRKCGASLASLTERIDTTTAAGEFYFHLMASLAQMERRQIGERTKAGLDYKRKRGERIGKVPFGYVLAADGVKLVEDPGEQATIALIRKMRADGYTFEELADKLNRDAIPTKSGAPWRPKLCWSICRRS